jgi:DNA-binding transcriptional MerR regulator
MEMIEQEFAEELRSFHLPKYEQLPDIGLYLEQATQYINHCLRPLGCVEITGAMIRNYVKMGLVPNPVQKRYHREHLAHLMSIAILKQVLPLEDIAELFHLQQATYSVEVAYNYFCEELENILWFQFGLKHTVDTIGTTSSLVKKMLRSAIIAVSHIIYLNVCLRQIPGTLEL